MHVDLKTVHYTEILNNLIECFNKFIVRIKNFDEKIFLDQINMNKICHFYIYLQLNHKKYNISQKLDIEFLDKITFYPLPSEEGYIFSNKGNQNYIFHLLQVLRNI